MFVGDVLEGAAAIIAAVATLVMLLALVTSGVAIAGALFVIAAYLGYAAQGYPLTPVPTVRLSRRAVRTAVRDPDKLGPKKPSLAWLPKESTWDEFKAALAKELDELAVTQVTAGIELQRLRAAGVVDVVDNKIVRV